LAVIKLVKICSKNSQNCVLGHVLLVCTNFVKMCTGAIKESFFDDASLRPDFPGGREQELFVRVCGVGGGCLFWGRGQPHRRPHCHLEKLRGLMIK